MTLMPSSDDCLEAYVQDLGVTAVEEGQADGLVTSE